MAVTIVTRYQAGEDMESCIFLHSAIVEEERQCAYLYC